MQVRSGLPRGTFDGTINVSVDPESIADALRALRSGPEDPSLYSPIGEGGRAA